MGKVKIRYYSVIRGRGYWQPTAAMRRAGFRPVSCGPDGPSAWTKAEDLNRAWDERAALPASAPGAPAVETWPAGSIGEAFACYRGTGEWSKKALRTREDWQRAWRYIAPVFGDCRPDAITMPLISAWRQTIEDGISLREAHRAMKIWRALWKVMVAMRFTALSDPSLGVRNTEAKGRRETWREGEAVRLVKRAWRMGYFGLAVALACMWDGAVSPVDARSIALDQRRRDENGTWFDLRRGKTGRDGIILLSRRSARLLEWYLATRFGGAQPIGSMPVFRTRRGATYRKNSFAEDFRDVRAVEFPGDARMMLDFRRSGAVEAVTGGAEGMVLSAMLANSIAESRKLEQTYVPVQAGMVRRAGDARRQGRKALRKGNE